MIKFLRRKTIMTFHEDQINQYGGNRGVRDKRKLKAALSKVESGNGEPYNDLFKIAAAYGFNLCHKEPFFDGCKRTALIAIYTFLFVNGQRLKADKNELYKAMIDMEDGNISLEELSSFLKDHSVSR